MVKQWASKIVHAMFRDQKIRLQVEWLTHTDEEIMEVLGREAAALTPAELADRLDRSEEYVADRCRQLSLNELLEQLDEQAEDDTSYRITEFGERYLSGDVDVEELQDSKSDAQSNRTG